MIWNLEDHLLFFYLYRFFIQGCREAAGWVAQFYNHRKNKWSHYTLATEQIVTKRVLSWSYIYVLPPDEKAKALEDNRVFLQREDGKVWIKKEE
ncbi:hypothetical protein EDB19DRAFT_1683413, partial [Suillus lakei]